MKEINLEEILKDNCVNIGFLKTMLSADGIKGSQGQRILDAMKDLSEQLLELAAENANLYDKNYPERIGRFKSIERGIDDWTKSNLFTIDKQSILDTIKQIK